MVTWVWAITYFASRKLRAGLQNGLHGSLNHQLDFILIRGIDFPNLEFHGGNNRLFLGILVGGCHHVSAEPGS